MNINYGWFSEKQSKRVGIMEYINDTGKPVQITCITSSPTEHGCEWDDIYCVGIVVEFKRVVSEPRVIDKSR